MKVGDLSQQMPDGLGQQLLVAFVDCYGADKPGRNAQWCPLRISPSRQDD
jgi:hypothetical protein